ncbi:ATP-binding protein [uncultured Piscinibacter sp.]|uniref:sensor histidine kinase n=1 Tax=uncultured Piscinibacter sp. TaxID=1131835 RepID=UPI00260B86E7|nr:ATP-binding protein [uncultured Piscinibacter sp.]
MSEAPRNRERRVGDRRAQRRAPTADESWFGAFGSAEDTQVSPDDATVTSAPDSSTRPAASTLDSRLFSRQAERIVSAGQTAFDRIYRTFIGARAALGVALVVAQAITGLFGARPSLEAALVSVAYGTMALILWLLPRRRTVEPKALARVFGAPWLSTIGIDLVAFSALHMLAPGSNLNYVALLVLPVLMAGVLTPRPLALATAAAVAMMLLVTAWLDAGAGGSMTQLMAQAALAGSGFFVITVLAGELAGRLAREELTARGNMEMARQQAALNRLVIEEMQDGILVVDRRGRVRAANPAARRLLAPSGMSRPAPFQLRGVEAWSGLVRTVEQAFIESSWPEAGRDVTLEFEPGSSRTLRVRVRFTRHKAAQASEDFCVLFLEDVRNMQARSRQEKLAAMGRVSAGIAHEIRNPLAAIAQANALLAEDATDASQRQLTRMVADNVDRLKRIVDDVMEVAPGEVQDLRAIDATALVAAVCSDWARAAGIKLDEHSVLRVELPPQPIGVAFDAEHLRRVLVNLLDNALRHASGAPGAVMLRLDSRDESRAFLSVASDGSPIPPEVERYLFEPFFSTRSRGTGLGLYICRELCERYGASIDYRARAGGDPHCNEFFVVMRRMPLTDTEARLHLTS